MLFPYTFVNHGVEKLHVYIEHLVLEVWCKAKDKFDIAKLHADFKPIVESNQTFLLGPITIIHDLFTKLTDPAKDEIADGFKRNNDIENICAGITEPFRYSDIDKIDKVLSGEINDFFKNLYSKVLKISAVKSECGDLDEHYDAFMKINRKGKCPFCGLSDLKSNLLSKRDAYDHYLPKDIYPFNSVNFKNLVPACNTCNSSYKLVKDPVFDSKTKKKRKAFYPFAAANPDLTISIQVQSLDFSDPQQNNIILNLNSATREEELTSWRDVYGMYERYMDKCKSEESRYWIQQVIDEAENYEKTQESALDMQIRIRKNHPFLDTNFLRVPFLEACGAKGLFK